ncbi:hypothetical protein LJC08_02065 [Methanimicrococcus sp. OttesenSCG-928-J09]|nr:hypothetical protein [Methanimicrococcus sp. OttesenSCG-928-J09]
MSKNGLLIAAVCIFLLIATAMALENKQAGENFTSQEYLNAKTIESTSSDSNVEDDEAEGYLLQNNPDRWTSMFSALQPYSGNESR